MKNLIYILVFTCCFLVGCDLDNPESEQGKEESYIYATVVKKTGTVVALQKAIENNQPIIILDRYPETLILQLKTDDGKIYTFDIYERWGFPTLRALNLALEDEARVKIKNSNCNLKGRIGSINTSNIEIVENSDK